MAEAITVHCPSCDTAFPVDPDKVPGGGVNARCSECSEIFRVEDPGASAAAAEPGIGEPETVEAEPAAEEPGAVEAEPTPGVESAESGPEGVQFEERDEPPSRKPAEKEPHAGEAFETAEGGPETAEDIEEEPAAEEMELDRVDYFFGGEAEEDRAEENDVAVDEDAGFEVDEPQPTEESPTARAAPETAEPPTEAPDEGTVPAEPGDREQDLSAPEEPRGGTPDTATAPERPSFGQRSPEEKAQRLARVLVSDMITYNPELYKQAVAQGTLAEDFEEEIEKSWEEYVEQVGEDLATSTPYWKDALNEILAEGEEMF